MSRRYGECGKGGNSHWFAGELDSRRRDSEGVNGGVEGWR